MKILYYLVQELSSAATFVITDTKLYVPIFTLKSEDNAKSSKLLKKGF